LIIFSAAWVVDKKLVVRELSRTVAPNAVRRSCRAKAATRAFPPPRRRCCSARQEARHAPLIGFTEFVGAASALCGGAIRIRRRRFPVTSDSSLRFVEVRGSTRSVPKIADFPKRCDQRGSPVVA